MKKKPLVVLTGPTAVGKTKASIGLAKAIGGEIISADSMQVYEYMDIGSAKIRPEEMQGIPHYLVDELKPWDEFHVVRFQQMAKKAMEQIYANGHIPIIVGGTGFYIQALLYDIDFTSTSQDDNYRQDLENLAKEKGAEYLHNMLREIDPKSAEDIHANNIKRVIRALEYYHQTGQKMSRHNEEERQKESPYEFVYFASKILNRRDSHIASNVGLMDGMRRSTFSASRYLSISYKSEALLRSNMALSPSYLISGSSPRSSRYANAVS